VTHDGALSGYRANLSIEKTNLFKDAGACLHQRFHHCTDCWRCVQLTVDDIFGTFSKPAYALAEQDAKGS
jgi:hypothetical protein